MLALRSAILDGTRHGFSTREGGVSTGRYASLNLSVGWGDERAHVDENRRRLARDGAFDLARLCTAKQVHGARVVDVDGRAPSEVAPEHADALVASEPGAVVAVLTADCTPILLSDTMGRVAAVHAGWRGTVARIAEAAVEALANKGADRARVRAALGPSIGPCCFEVGEEVAEVFARLAPASVARRPEWPRPHVDLRRANRVVLEAAGILADNIDDRPPCTMCEPARFYSFRRDGGGIGQMLSYVVAG